MRGQNQKQLTNHRPGNCSDPAGASSESIDENHPDDLGMIRDKM